MYLYLAYYPKAFPLKSESSCFHLCKTIAQINYAVWVKNADGAPKSNCNVGVKLSMLDSEKELIIDYGERCNSFNIDQGIVITVIGAGLGEIKMTFSKI